MRPLAILDSTLREGEQFAGAFFSFEQRLKIARLLRPGGVVDMLTQQGGLLDRLTAEGGGLERALKPGGLAAILEFSQPTNRIFGAFYGFFSTRVLPWVGGLISGSRDAYSYLPESIASTILGARNASRIRRAT